MLSNSLIAFTADGDTPEEVERDDDDEDRPHVNAATFRVEDRPVSIFGKFIGDIVGGDGKEEGYEVSFKHAPCWSARTFSSEILKEIEWCFAELELHLEHFNDQVHGTDMNCAAAIFIDKAEDPNCHLPPVQVYAKHPLHSLKQW